MSVTYCLQENRYFNNKQGGKQSQHTFSVEAFTVFVLWQYKPSNNFRTRLR